jgi:nucleoside-diphosphate-sugar epimerase
MNVALVTGGTGFIGSALAAELASTGTAVRVLSRRDVPVPPGVSLVHGDLLSRESLDSALAGCDAVFHCAGEKRDISRMQAVNIDGTRLLVELAVARRIRQLCHLSSVGVIGLTAERVVSESTSCRPMIHYEKTKLAAENLLAAGVPGARVVILRPTNVFGTHTLTALARPSVAARIELSLKARENAHFVYVRDVVAAALHLSRHAGHAVETCIVSSDEEAGNTHGEIQEVIAARIPGAPRPLVKLPSSLPYYLRRIRTGAANRGDIVFSAARLRATGFRFPFGLAGGLRHALDFR